MEHVAIPAGEIHQPHNWEFADAAERDAEVITDTTLVGRIALVLDDGSFWRLESADPAVWTAFVAEPSAHEHDGADITSGTVPVARQPEYVHTQGSASDTWTINHSLGRKPKIALLTVGGVEFEGFIQHTSDNQAVASLSVAIAGTARCTV